MRLRVGFPVSSCSPLYLRRHAKIAPGICEGAHDRARLLPHGDADGSQDRHPHRVSHLGTSDAERLWRPSRGEFSAKQEDDGGNPQPGHEADDRA